MKYIANVNTRNEKTEIFMCYKVAASHVVVNKSTCISCRTKIWHHVETKYNKFHHEIFYNSVFYILATVIYRLSRKSLAADTD